MKRNRNATVKAFEDAFASYLSSDGRKVTTWTGGELMVVTKETEWRIFSRFRKCGSCISATDCHGKRWHGRGAGRGMYITLRPCK